MADAPRHEAGLDGYSDTERRYDRVVERVQAQRAWPPPLEFHESALRDRPDAQLVDAIVQRLEAEPGLARLGVLVDYRHGSIRLQGTVPHAGLAQVIERIAQEVAGPTPITNELRVAPAA